MYIRTYVCTYSIQCLLNLFTFRITAYTIIFEQIIYQKICYKMEEHWIGA